MYNFDAVGDSDELIRFCGQNVKGLGHSETTYGHTSTLGGIFSAISRMRGCIVMKLSYSLAGSHDRDDIFKVII